MKGKFITEKPNVVSGLNIKRERMQYNPKPNPYDGGKEKFLKDLEAHRVIVKEKGQFRTWDLGGKTFSTQSQTYSLPKNIPAKKIFDPKLNILKHEAPFIPSNPPKKGYNSAINKFPKYIEDPPKPLVRTPQTDKEKRENFKPSHNGLSRPTPSITLNRINIKKVAGSRLL